jgi:hypothetical protein
MVYLLDALFAELAPDQWLSLGAEVVVNALGVVVGVAGLRGTATLDQVPSDTQAARIGMTGRGKLKIKIKINMFKHPRRLR